MAMTGRANLLESGGGVRPFLPFGQGVGGRLEGGPLDGLAGIGLDVLPDGPEGEGQGDGRKDDEHGEGSST